MFQSIGGVRSPPNMTRLLFRWGLGERLRKVSTVCSRIAFRLGMCSVGNMYSTDCLSVKLGTNMEHLSALVFHKEVMRALDGNVLLIHVGVFTLDTSVQLRH